MNRRTNLAGAVLAAAAALLLLTGTGTSLAGWTGEAGLSGAVITSGQLSTSLQHGSASIHRGDTVVPVGAPLLPGDSLVVETAVTVEVAGVNGELVLDASDAAAALQSAGIVLDAPSIEVIGLTGAVTGATWRGQVGEAENGALVTAVVTLPVSRTLSPEAQGRAADLSTTPVTWNLTQEQA